VSLADITPDARQVLRAVGLTLPEWAREQGWLDGVWRGDHCGCSDDRCIGYHHDVGEECGCLLALLCGSSTAPLSPIPPDEADRWGEVFGIPGAEAIRIVDRINGRWDTERARRREILGWR